MKLKSRRKAFSLVELLIAIGIMGILLIISIATFETYDRRNSLILTADSLKSFILNAKADAQSRDSDLWTEGKEATLSLEVQSDGRTINEYRSFGGNKYPSGSDPRVFRSFVIDKKYDIISPSNLKIVFDAPTGEISSPASLDIILTRGGDSATISINNENITINRSF